MTHLLFNLKRPLQNGFLTDAYQKRGRKGACGAIIMRNSDPSKTQTNDKRQRFDILSFI